MLVGVLYDDDALLLVVWGLIRVSAPEKGAGVSAKYYSGLGSAEVIQVVWGAVLLIIGMLVIIGLFRRFIGGKTSIFWK